MAAAKKPVKLNLNSSFSTVQPRRSLHSNRGGLKWDAPSSPDFRSRDAPRGTRPVADPMSLKQLGVVLAMHVCRKILIAVSPARKVAFYGLLLTIGSVLCDFAPLPQSYMSRKDNALNVYFAKWSWLWSLLLVGGFVGLTSFVYCCGDTQRVRRHLYRLAVGTAVWYSCVSAFAVLESATGLCVGASGIRAGLDRDSCLKRPGFRWRGFDISGHTFLLIYCNLMIHEEARAMRGFDHIRDLIREHDSSEDSPLKTLSLEELYRLKEFYPRLSGYVKASFASITLLAVLWDVVLVGTVLYFHTMAQKVAGGLVAVAVWYLTYRVFYTMDMSPGLPGQGPFKYAEVETPPTMPAAENRRRSLVGGPIRLLQPSRVGDGPQQFTETVVAEKTA